MQALYKESKHMSRNKSAAVVSIAPKNDLHADNNTAAPCSWLFLRNVSYPHLLHFLFLFVWCHKRLKVTNHSIHFLQTSLFMQFKFYLSIIVAIHVRHDQKNANDCSIYEVSFFLEYLRCGISYFLFKYSFTKCLYFLKTLNFHTNLVASKFCSSLNAQTSISIYV